MNSLRRLGVTARAVLRSQPDRRPAAVEAYLGERRARDVLR